MEQEWNSRLTTEISHILNNAAVARKNNWSSQLVNDVDACLERATRTYPALFALQRPYSSRSKVPIYTAITLGLVASLVVALIPQHFSQPDRAKPQPVPVGLGVNPLTQSFQCRNYPNFTICFEAAAMATQPLAPHLP